MPYQGLGSLVMCSIAALTASKLDQNSIQGELLGPSEFWQANFQWPMTLARTGSDVTVCFGTVQALFCKGWPSWYGTNREVLQRWQDRSSCWQPPLDCHLGNWACLPWVLDFPRHHPNDFKTRFGRARFFLEKLMILVGPVGKSGDLVICWFQRWLGWFA